LLRKAQIFFPEFNIRLYDKNSESYYFFFSPPKSEYFFQRHWESEYFFRKKNQNLPPCKLNGPSLNCEKCASPSTFYPLLQRFLEKICQWNKIEKKQTRIQTTRKITSDIETDITVN
jgi:hypothetical protein